MDELAAEQAVELQKKEIEHDSEFGKPRTPEQERFDATLFYVGATPNSRNSRKHAVADYRLADQLPDKELAKALKRKVLRPRFPFTKENFPPDVLKSAGSIEEAFWKLYQESKTLEAQLQAHREVIKQAAEGKIQEITNTAREFYQRQRELLIQASEGRLESTIKKVEAEIEELNKKEDVRIEKETKKYKEILNTYRIN